MKQVKEVKRPHKNHMKILLLAFLQLTFKVTHVLHNTLVGAVRIWTSFTDGRWAVRWAGR